MENGKKRSDSKNIGDFFHKRRNEDKSVCNEAIDNNPCVVSEEWKPSSDDSLCYPLGRGSGYEPIPSITISQVMRVIAGNIPLTWGHMDGCPLFWRDILASYYCTDTYFSRIADTSGQHTAIVNRS